MKATNYFFHADPQGDGFIVKALQAFCLHALLTFFSRLTNKIWQSIRNIIYQIKEINKQKSSAKKPDLIFESFCLTLELFIKTRVSKLDFKSFIIFQYNQGAAWQRLQTSNNFLSNVV